MIHKEFPFLTIHWDENGKIVVMEWKKFAAEQEFRDGLNEGLDLLIKKKTSKWLADLRFLGVVTSEDQKWSNEDWFPRAIAGGVKKMALVIPQSALAKMSVHTIMQKVQDLDLETHYFDSVESAKDWLL